ITYSADLTCRVFLSTTSLETIALVMLALNVHSWLTNIENVPSPLSHAPRPSGVPANWYLPTISPALRKAVSSTLPDAGLSSDLCEVMKSPTPFTRFFRGVKVWVGAGVGVMVGAAVAAEVASVVASASAEALLDIRPPITSRNSTATVSKGRY